MKIKLKHTKFQIAVEIITILFLIGMIAYIFVMWKETPDKVPGHYNGAGEITRWGNKSELLVLPIVSVGLYLLLTVIMFFPSIWNVPVTVTERNKDKVYNCLKSMIVLLKAEVIVTFFYLSYNGVQATPLSPDFLQVELTAIFGTLIFFIIRVIKVSKD